MGPKPIFHYTTESRDAEIRDLQRGVRATPMKKPLQLTDREASLEARKSYFLSTLFHPHARTHTHTHDLETEMELLGNVYNPEKVQPTAPPNPNNNVKSQAQMD